MKPGFNRIAEVVTFFVLAILVLYAACWAGPPGPPTIAAAPTTPAGGTVISLATAVAIAGYGIWKSRK